MRYLAFDFSQFLSKKEQSVLANSAKWQWITPFSTLPYEGKITVPEKICKSHQRWANTPGNCHTPAHREIMLTLQGEAVYSINNHCVMRRPGTVILLDRYTTRDVKGSRDKLGFSCLWLHFLNSEYMTYYINTCDKNGRYSHRLPMRIQSGESVRLLMNTWEQCRISNDPMSRTFLKSLITATLFTILGSLNEVSSKNQKETIVAPIQKYIREHLAENLNLNSLANIAGYSPYFFHRLFTKTSGQTLVQFINSERLSKAAELLKQGYTVQAAAEAVGFSSVSYFHQFFKKNMRCTPAAWRENKKA